MIFPNDEAHWITNMGTIDESKPVYPVNLNNQIIIGSVIQSQTGHLQNTDKKILFTRTTVNNKRYMIIGKN